MSQAQLPLQSPLAEPARSVAGDDEAMARLGESLRRRPAGFTGAKEWVIEALLFIAAASSVVITIGIVGVLLKDAVAFFTDNYEVHLNSRVPAEVRPALLASLEREWTMKPEDAVAFVDSIPKVVPYQQGPEAEKFRLMFQAHGVPLAIRQKTLFGEFFTSREWGPTFEAPKHGIWPLVAGTFTTTLVALLVAVPVGTVCAIWLSEYSPPRLREAIKPALELLAAVPTVVYGFFALLFLTPLLQKFIPGLGAFNMLSAGLVMGVMIIPYVSSLSEDAMRAVPMHMREGAYAMGATKMQTAFRVIFPSAFSGITAAYILGISRAIGETMVVAIAAGQQPNLTVNPSEQGATITAYIVSVAKGDLPHGSRGYNSIFAAGLALLVMTLVFNIGGYWLRKRYREAY